MVSLSTMTSFSVINRLLPFFFFFFSPALVSSSSSSSSISLTKETFEQVTAGKIVFIKWFAPWCSHCQALEPIWEKLANTDFSFTQKKEEDEQQQELSTLLFAQVDCTVEEAWCLEMGITGFPTLTFGETSFSGAFLEEYTMDKTYDDLYNFVTNTLLLSSSSSSSSSSQNNNKKKNLFCNPGNIQACDEEQQSKIYKYWNMTQAELDNAIQADENKMKQYERTFYSKKNELQIQYDQAALQYEKDVAKLKRQLKIYKEFIHTHNQQQQQQESGIHGEL